MSTAVQNAFTAWLNLQAAKPDTSLIGYFLGPHRHIRAAHEDYSSALAELHSSEECRALHKMIAEHLARSWA